MGGTLLNGPDKPTLWRQPDAPMKALRHRSVVSPFWQRTGAHPSALGPATAGSPSAFQGVRTASHPQPLAVAPQRAQRSVFVGVAGAGD